VSALRVLVWLVSLEITLYISLAIRHITRDARVMRMDWWINVGIAVCSYLLGMAFAGSFLGRKWMGTVDVFLHKVFKKEVTTSKYLVWKHFYCLDDPPKPPSMKNPRKLTEILLAKLL